VYNTIMQMIYYLLAPSVNALQLLLSTCELELRKLDLFISSNPRRHYRHLTLTLIRGFLSGGGLSGHFGVTWKQLHGQWVYLIQISL